VAPVTGNGDYRNCNCGNLRMCVGDVYRPHLYGLSDRNLCRYVHTRKCNSYRRSFANKGDGAYIRY
jgi:hypothetical protein